MAATAADTDRTLKVPIGSIEVKPEFNARMLAPDDPSLEGLAASIGSSGIIVPLIVVHNVDHYDLVAGHRRLAAARRVGLEEIPVIVRDPETAEADAAIENVSRSQLTPLEEGRAIKSMVDKGFTPEGAGTTLGVAPQVVVNRLRLMGLPEPARLFFGPEGHLGPRHVDELAAVATIHEEACVALATEWNESPTSDPGWLLHRADVKDLWPAHSTYRINDGEYGRKADLNIGKKWRNMGTEMVRKEHGYTSPYEPQLTDLELDAARALGVLIELDRYGFIVGKDVIVDLLRRRVEADHAEWKERPKETAKAKAAKSEDPKAEAKRQARAALRDLSVQAQGVNLQIGSAFLNELAEVDVSMDVARFWVYGLLRSEGHFRDDGKISSGYGASYAAEIGQAGIRLVIGDLRSEQTSVKKDGTPGKSKVIYATARECEAWLWKFLDGAKTPEQLFGRGLVLYAAGRYAMRHAVTRSNQFGDPAPRGYKDRASKALDAIAKKHLPASAKSLAKAIDKANMEASKLGL